MLTAGRSYDRAFKSQEQFAGTHKIMTSHDYVATRTELTRLLQQTMTPVIYTRLTGFYNDSIKYGVQHRIASQEVFVALLKEVPNWNATCIDHEEGYIKEKVLKIYGAYKALWIATLMVISSVRLGAQKDIQTTVRPFRDFVHEIYKEVAKDLECDPGLFDHTGTPAQLRKNRKEALELIAAVIPDALRNLLPMAEIYGALDEDVDGQQVFAEKKTLDEGEDGHQPSSSSASSSSSEPDELEDIRRDAERMKKEQPGHDSPKPSYGSPPRTPQPADHSDHSSDSDDEPPREEPEEYGGFTSEHSGDDDDDPYLKDLPSDYDSRRRPEAEDDYPDSENDY